MLGLEWRGEPADVAAVHGRERAAHGDGLLVLGVRELELPEAVEAADQRRAVAFAGAETECGGGVGDGELDALRRPLEAVGEVAHEQERSGAEGREPEGLGVPGAGVVAENVEYGVVPGSDAERGGHGSDSSLSLKTSEMSQDVLYMDIRPTTGCARACVPSSSPLAAPTTRVHFHPARGQGRRK